MAKKRYIIQNKDKFLLRTDILKKADKKVLELQEAREPWFTLTDTKDGHLGTFWIEQGQKNYRTQVTKIKPPEN